MRFSKDYVGLPSYDPGKWSWFQWKLRLRVNLSLVSRSKRNSFRVHDRRLNFALRGSHVCIVEVGPKMPHFLTSHIASAVARMASQGYCLSQTGQDHIDQHFNTNGSVQKIRYSSLGPRLHRKIVANYMNGVGGLSPISFSQTGVSFVAPEFKPNGSEFWGCAPEVSDPV